MFIRKLTWTPEMMHLQIWQKQDNYPIHNIILPPDSGTNLAGNVDSINDSVYRKCATGTTKFPKRNLFSITRRNKWTDVSFLSKLFYGNVIALYKYGVHSNILLLLVPSHWHKLETLWQLSNIWMLCCWLTVTETREAPFSLVHSDGSFISHVSLMESLKESWKCRLIIHSPRWTLR